MTSKIIYKGNLKTEATHLISKSIIETAAPPDNNGDGSRFSPTDLVATALGSCMLTIMGIAGNTHNIDIEGTTIDCTKIMANDPRRIGEIQIILHFPKDKNYTDKEKTILERSAMNCPVLKSLNENLIKTVEFIY